MKSRAGFKSTFFFFMLALILLIVGIIGGVWTFSQFEQLAQSHESHESLLSSIRLTALYAVLSGGVAVTGVGILVTLCLHQIRRTAMIHAEVSALRQKNQEIEALNEKIQQLAHHQRLETIGTLTSSIAHEFNNLLTPIMGYSLMALEKLPPEEEELYDGILEIYNTSRKAKELISRLSDLSRKNTSTTFHRISPDELIRKTLAVATPAKPENVEIQLDLNCWDQRIEANEIQISQLLLNLILNGFQAMGTQGGVLTVCTSYDENDIQIRVSDTGCGIPEEIQELIFQPFFTTKEAGKGTGLGLAIVAQVVEDHHGQIRVNSQVSHGTTFTVTLPRSLK